MRRLASSLALVLPLALVSALHGESFNYSITTGPTNGGPGVSFSTTGTLTGVADPYQMGAYDINGITGNAPTGQTPIYTFSNVYQANTNSQTTATASGFTFDNVLFANTPNSLVDSNGFLLYLTSNIGTSLAHVYNTASGYRVNVVDPNDPGDVTAFAITSFTITPSTVPEPSSLLLLGTGLVGAVGVARRRWMR